MILKVASNFNAEEYWVDRKRIGNEMKIQLDTALSGTFAM
jgi:hypothetical protein